MMTSDMMESWDVVEWGKPLQKRVREMPQPTGTEVLLRVTESVDVINPQPRHDPLLQQARE